MFVVYKENTSIYSISQKKIVSLYKQLKCKTGMKVDFQIMLNLIKQNVHEVEPTAEVWLYGSRVRGEAREDSDWDVLVLSAKDKLSFKEEEQFMDHICNLMVKTGQAIQLFAYGAKDWHTRHSLTPFYQNVQKEAVLL